MNKVEDECHDKNSITHFSFKLTLYHLFISFSIFIRCISAASIIESKNSHSCRRHISCHGEKMQFAVSFKQVNFFVPIFVGVLVHIRKKEEN
jgi:hypothetical protein